MHFSALSSPSSSLYLYLSLFFYPLPSIPPLCVSASLPLHFEFGCLVVYLCSFLLLPVSQGGRWRSSRSGLSNGVRAQPVSDESSTWLDHLYWAWLRTSICISKPSETLQGWFQHEHTHTHTHTRKHTVGHAMYHVQASTS